jgi:transcriptional regulator with PAS, ATPase and Fis domain
VIGESGVGKKVFQKLYIHYRKHGKYIAVNCGAIPEVLLIVNYLGMKKTLQEQQVHERAILK